MAPSLSPTFAPNIPAYCKSRVGAGVSLPITSVGAGVADAVGATDGVGNTTLGLSGLSLKHRK